MKKKKSSVKNTRDPGADPKLLLISLLQGSHRNLSCLSLFSFLRAQGVEVDLLFIPRQETYRRSVLTDFIRTRGYAIVGISVMTDMFSFAQTLTKDIKKNIPDLSVIWGGIHPTLRPEECLNAADSVFIGEAEATILPFLRAFARNEDVSACAGVASRDSSGKLHCNPPSRVMELDSLPIVEYDWRRFFVYDHPVRPFGTAEYAAYSHYHGEDYTLMTTRSCPYSCAYCCNSFLNDLYQTKGSIRRRSVRHVLQEIHAALRKMPGVRFINFIDDQFFIHRKWNEEFCAAYKKEVGLPFIVRLKPGTFTASDLAMLKNAGLQFVQIGLQSGSERTNRLIFSRKFDRSVMIASSRMLAEQEIFAFYDVIIQNELENDADRNETIKLLLALTKPFKCFFYSLTPFPETRLERLYRARGITPRADPYGKGYADINQNDFYVQLASIIPYTSSRICAFFLDHAREPYVRKTLAAYYRQTKELGNHRVTTAQNRAQESFAGTTCE